MKAAARRFGITLALMWAVCFGLRLYVVGVEPLTVIRTPTSLRVRAFADDGVIACVVAEKQDAEPPVRLFDVRTGTALGKFGTPHSTIGVVSFRRNGELGFHDRSAGAVHFVDRATGKERARFVSDSVADPWKSIDWSEDTSRFVAYRRDPSGAAIAEVVDAETLKVVRKIDGERHLTMSRDGTCVVSFAAQNRSDPFTYQLPVSVIDVATEVERQLPIPANRSMAVPSKAVFSANGGFIAVCLAESLVQRPEIALWWKGKGRTVRTVTVYGAGDFREVLHVDGAENPIFDTSGRYLFYSDSAVCEQRIVRRSLESGVEEEVFRGLADEASPIGSTHTMEASVCKLTQANALACFRSVVRMPSRLEYFVRQCLMMTPCHVADPEIHIVQCNDGSVNSGTIRCEETGKNATFSPDGKWIVVSTSNDSWNELSIYEFPFQRYPTRKLRRSFPDALAATAVLFTVGIWDRRRAKRRQAAASSDKKTEGNVA